MCGKQKLLILLLLGMFSAAFADNAPVVDYSTQSEHAIKSTVKVVSAEGNAPVASNEITSVTETHANLTADERLGKLEGQVANLNQQDAASKIEDLQERLQKLNGTVEDQEHAIAQLRDQLRDFYQDLDQRIGNGKNTTTDSAGDASADQVKKKPSLTKDKKSVQATTNDDRSSLKEQQLYQTAVDLLPSAESAKKLRAYLKAYPNGAYVSGAHYWLGEVYFSEKNFTASEAEFKLLVQKYTDSPKIADAMFKIALIHDAQNKHDQAKNEMRQIVKKFPSSQAAKLAQQQLKAN